MSNIQTAYLGGGCFWCTEALFETIPGVKNVVSGYAGGKTEDPSYEQVSHESTGHAEVIKIEFDADAISYQELIEIFFEVHDPTTLNRQGADQGEQYRSIILFTDEEQQKIAHSVIDNLEQAGKFSDPIVTELQKFREFYEAEEHHQDYFSKDPSKAYCQLVISPKLQKLREKLNKKT